MSAWVGALLGFRRCARHLFPYAVAGILAHQITVGALRENDLYTWHGGVALALWIVAFALPRRRGQNQDPPKSLTVSRAVLLVVLTRGLIEGLGQGPDLYPTLYILMAFLATFCDWRAMMAAVLTACTLELSLHRFSAAPVTAEAVTIRCTFVVLFALLNVIFNRVELLRTRKLQRERVEAERAQVDEDAKIFRLVATPSLHGRDNEERLLRSSVQEVHQSLFHLVHLLKGALKLHTCIILLKDDHGSLRVAEVSSDSEQIKSGPILAGHGPVGLTLSNGEWVQHDHLKPGYQNLGYYRGPSQTKHFVSVPIIHRCPTHHTADHTPPVLGVLCADRTRDEPFHPEDRDVLVKAAEQIRRTMDNERLVVQLERSKHEQNILYEASQTFGAALTPAQVIEAGTTAVEKIVAHDFVALTRYIPGEKRHCVEFAAGRGAANVQDLAFKDNHGLISMVVQNRHYLPLKGNFDPHQQFVFTRRSSLSGLRSVLVMPLLAQDRALGTLVLGAERADAFTESARTSLEVISTQLAVSLANAQAVRRLEEMATTDGLTGCLNKRAFMEEFEAKLAAAERFGRRLSLLVTDIDHFKGVNDTHGHAMGDVVLKSLGALLQQTKRQTDLVARFGGEEFCVLCEETDTDGAILLAERVREELERQVYPTEKGNLHVTTSIGVATFPRHAQSSRALFEAADQALYEAKHAGRNRVVTAKRRLQGPAHLSVSA